MHALLTIHLKSGKAQSVALALEAANTISVDFADWHDPSVTSDGAPVINIADRQGNRTVIPFSAVEFIEVQAR